MRRLLLLAIALAGATPAHAQTMAPGTPSGTPVTMTISSSAKTILTATGGSTTLCPDTRGGVLLQVLNNGIYFTLTPNTAPTSSFYAASAGAWIYVKPWTSINMIRQSADTTVVGQCFQ